MAETRKIELTERELTLLDKALELLSASPLGGILDNSHNEIPNLRMKLKSREPFGMGR
jgi:hypothetical protein